MTSRTKEILSWYRSENNAVLANLYKLINTGTLAGTGKFVILPVDQGFEHGPARSFAPNPAGYDPAYHFELAIEAGCNAYVGPYGQVAAAVNDYVGQIPIIIKLNNSDSLHSGKNPVPAITCSVREAQLLGATAVGYTIYPASSFKKEMYEEVAEIGEEARSCGLPLVLWSYPRGEGISKEGETAIDVVAYAAQIACQLGAHIVKVKPPTAHIEQAEAKKVYEKYAIKIDSLSDRIGHVVQSCFGGRRIVIFSGGPAKTEDEIFEEVSAINAGGGFGSIMGRNSFQRTRSEGVKLLRKIMSVYKG